MACPWGCRPEGGFLDDATARRLLRRADVIGAKTTPAGHHFVHTHSATKSSSNPSNSSARLATTRADRPRPAY